MFLCFSYANQCFNIYGFCDLKSDVVLEYKWYGRPTLATA